MPIEKSAGAIVFYQWPDSKIEYLLLRHSDKYWNFPKGHIEAGETEEKAARREVKEETGLDVEIMPGFKVWEKYFFRSSKEKGKVEDEGKIIFKLVIFYLAQAKNKNVKISFEHQGYEWLNLEKALARVKKYKTSGKILRKADGFLKSYFMKNNGKMV